MINCPIDREMLCQECRYNFGEKCWWFFPARPLSEILTNEERLDMLEERGVAPPIKVFPRYIIPSKVIFAKLFGRIEQLEGQTKYLHNKLTEKIAKDGF